MAWLLLIDTATEYGAVAVSHHEELIAVQENGNQKEHASFLHPAIDAVVKAAGISFHQIDAVGVTIGPGSYTGLRVGLTAAKGICYVLNKPLVAVNTLQAMALASIESTSHMKFVKPVLHAPMMDARRMEVYTGLYTDSAEVYRIPQAIIIDNNIFVNESERYIIAFSGNCTKKMRSYLFGDQFILPESIHSMKHVAAIANKHFLNSTFENTAYCEPFYLKPFYSFNFVKK